MGRPPHPPPSFRQCPKENVFFSLTSSLMVKVMKIPYVSELFPNEEYVACRESKCRAGCANFALQSHNAYCMHNIHDIHIMHIMQDTNIARRPKCKMCVCKRYMSTCRTECLCTTTTIRDYQVSVDYCLK